MNKTENHRRRIINILRTQGERGISSKYLITEVTPRYSARLNELKKQGYKFRTKREAIGGSNFIRIWLGDKPPEKNFIWKFEGNTAYKQFI